MDLKDRCQVYTCTFIHCTCTSARYRDTLNTQQASYQFCRGPCDACDADHVINSSRPSASVFSSPAFNYYAQCARRGGGRRPGNEATRIIPGARPSPLFDLPIPAQLKRARKGIRECLEPRLVRSCVVPHTTKVRCYAQK